MFYGRLRLCICIIGFANTIQFRNLSREIRVGQQKILGWVDWIRVTHIALGLDLG